jgi:signal transduction histidine kinase/CheY-like chemotaxis protein
VVGNQTRPAGARQLPDPADITTDVGLTAALFGTVFLDEVVVWFHLAFLLATVAAYRRSTRAFLVRGVSALVIVSVVLVFAWLDDAVPFDEVLELPILATVSGLVHVAAVRRRRLTVEVDTSQRSVERLQQARLSDRQERALLDLSMESTGWLTATATHDLNNILATILATSESVAVQNPDMAPAAERIEAGVLAAKHLVSDIAELSRSPAESATCDLDEVVREALTLHVGDAPIEVRTTLAVPRRRVRLPRVLAYQVVSNLVVNAITAMAEGGVLEVSTEVSATTGQIELSVKDDGVGMSDAVKDRAFEPYFTTRPISGSGVGLYSVSRIVDAAGGSLGLASAQGEGTTVMVGFPVAPDAAPAERLLTPAPKGRSILLVEDEPALRERWVGPLRVAGWDVTAAGTAEEALQLVAESGASPDVLVTDLVMPGMSGVELIEALRQESPGLITIVVSGRLSELPSAWDSDAQLAALAKPVALQRLLEAVEEIGGSPVGSLVGQQTQV